MTDSAAIAVPGLRRIVTPEGVALGVTLADRGSRAAAFLVDMLLIVAGVVGLVLAGWLLTAAISGWGLAAAMLGFFVLRNFYFSFFELRGRGVTPGKRLLRLRVIDRTGGPLRPDAVVARNLMREIEVFVPLSLLATPQLTGDAAIAQALLILWAAIFVLMPFLNRDRLRLGDLVGGTMVIAVPRAALASDIAGASPSGAPKASARYGFSDAQLEIYGIYELQTLEGVLRRTDPQSATTRQEIARRIQTRIGWEGQTLPSDADRFLEDFYIAQRARLERKLLFGVRRKDKHDRP
jgi:uncharacterized RDD family membrane protein YckC